MLRTKDWSSSSWEEDVNARRTKKTDDDGRQPIAIGHLSYMYPGSLLQGTIRKTQCIVIMTKEVSTKIVNFMTPGAGVLV